MTLPREASKSTEEVANLKSWYQGEDEAIMTSETLTYAAKRKRREELRQEYNDRMTHAAAAAAADMAEWTEIYESRAASAWDPPAPKDREAAVLRALKVQNLHARIERLAKQGR